MGINAAIDKNQSKEVNTHPVNIIPPVSGCLEQSVAWRRHSCIAYGEKVIAIVMLIDKKQSKVVITHYVNIILPISDCIDQSVAVAVKILQQKVPTRSVGEEPADALPLLQDARLVGG